MRESQDVELLSCLDSSALCRERALSLLLPWHCQFFVSPKAQPLPSSCGDQCAPSSSPARRVLFGLLWEVSCIANVTLRSMFRRKGQGHGTSPLWPQTNGKYPHEVDTAPNPERRPSITVPRTARRESAAARRDADPWDEDSATGSGTYDKRRK